MKSTSIHILEKLLNSRIEVQQIRDESFPHGFNSKAEIVPSSRFILFTGGEITYRIENQDLSCTAGVVLFVPPWVWREWEVVSTEPASLVWTVFTASERVLNTMKHAIAFQPKDFSFLLNGMKRIVNRAPATEENALLLEGELKSILANFFNVAEISGETPSPEHHPEIDYAMRWLQAHYDVPSALAELYEQITLNASYFRELFQRQVHQSPNQYLTTLRMRAARFFLNQGSMTVKEVAARTGYQDPLYFARAYRRFWNRPPSKDRHA